MLHLGLYSSIHTQKWDEFCNIAKCSWCHVQLLQTPHDSWVPEDWDLKHRERPRVSSVTGYFVMQESTTFGLTRVARIFLLRIASSPQFLPACYHHPTLRQQRPKYVAAAPAVDCWDTSKLKTEAHKDSVWIPRRWPPLSFTGVTEAHSDVILLVNLCTRCFVGGCSRWGILKVNVFTFGLTLMGNDWFL